MTVPKAAGSVWIVTPAHWTQVIKRLSYRTLTAPIPEITPIREWKNRKFSYKSTRRQSFSIWTGIKMWCPRVLVLTIMTICWDHHSLILSALMLNRHIVRRVWSYLQIACSPSIIILIPQRQAFRLDTPPINLQKSAGLANFVPLSLSPLLLLAKLASLPLTIAKNTFFELTLNSY